MTNVRKRGNNENTVTQPRVLAKVPSKSNPLKSYEIRLGGDGVVYCTCRAWITNKFCKHLEEYHGRCLQVHGLRASGKSSAAVGQSQYKPMTATEVAMRQATAIPEFFKAQANQGTGTPETDKIYLTVTNGIMRGVWDVSKH